LTPPQATTTVALVARPAPSERDGDLAALPDSVRFPVELEPPPGFDPADLDTWPQVEGSLEWVAGRLLYMPPCARFQRVTVVDVVFVLAGWMRHHPEFEVASNEAGMQLGEDIRGADAAVWQRAALDLKDPGVARVPPILAVEVCGRRETERTVREKARWYFDRGVKVVWIVLPKTREVVVLTLDSGEHRLGVTDRIPPHPALPGLTPQVAEFFVQLSA
jgi:Uma2 family endonuclease